MIGKTNSSIGFGDWANNPDVIKVAAVDRGDALMIYNNVYREEAYLIYAIGGAGSLPDHQLNYIDLTLPGGNKTIIHIVAEGTQHDKGYIAAYIYKLTNVPVGNIIGEIDWHSTLAIGGRAMFLIGGPS